MFTQAIMVNWAAAYCIISQSVMQLAGIYMCMFKIVGLRTRDSKYHRQAVGQNCDRNVHWTNG